MSAALEPGAPESDRRVQEVLEHSRDVLDRAKHFRKPPRFTLLDDTEIDQLPEPTWLIKGVMPSNGLIALVGAPKSYKSFVALDWACSIPLGLEWHGRAVRPGPVVYVYAEGLSGLRQRVTAWKRFARLEQPLGVLFLPRRISLNEELDTRDLVTAIRARIDATPPALIIIDTLSRNLAGNENASEDMGAFVRGCDTLREETGAAVLVVHHKGHAAEDRSRGHSSFEAACDTVILCTKDEDRLTLECKWMKDAEDGWQLGMETVPIPPSLALRASGVNDGGLKGQRLLCLRVLHDNYPAEGAAYKSWIEAARIPGSSFNKARDWLQTRTYVKTENGRWRLTDAGRLALSTHSTPTPSGDSGAGASKLHSTGGSLRPPVVEQARHGELIDVL